MDVNTPANRAGQGSRFMILWPFFLSPFGAREERWMATSDEEKRLVDVMGEMPLRYDTYLSAGDAVDMHDGKLWIVTRSGKKEVAMVVEGRYKKPTELYK